MSQLAMRDEWYTPDSFFDRVAHKFGPFDLDAAASALNSKCKRYLTEDDDALSQPWHGSVWCNPPYKNLMAWVTKAEAEVRSGNASQVVMLLPGHVGAAWFHWSLTVADVYFVKGKLTFGGGSYQSPFGSIILVFRRDRGLKMPVVGTIDRGESCR